MTRRATVLTATLAVLAAAASFAATTGPFGGGAASTTVYGCFNSGGHLEAATVGLTPQPCAHRSDTIQTWTVTQYVPPGTTTTTSASTSSSAATTTTVSPTTVAVTSTTVGGTTTTGAPSGLWKPSSAHSLTWLWQIGSVPTPKAGFDVVDEDVFDANNVTGWHAFGTKAIAYIDAGTYEPGRPDLNLIPALDIGANVAGWPGEKWLDVRDIAGLTPLIAERVKLAATKGFDGIEFDNIDSWDGNNPGFPITGADQIAYNKMLFATAHAYGMSAALKNDVSQLAALEPFADFAINEQCAQYSECSGYSAFTGANKAVLQAEYQGGISFCANAATGHRDAALFSIDLDGSVYQPCPAWP